MRRADGFKKGTGLVTQRVTGEEREPRHEFRIPPLDLTVEAGSVELRYTEIAQNHVVGALQSFG